MKEPLIELRGVSKRFGDNVILDGLDLTIYRGEALVIIGPSGTGKSTVLRLIAGLTGINGGEIRIKGQLRQGLLEDGREAMRTSLVFQQTALFDSLTVGENVGFYLYEQAKLKKARIRELVEKSLEMVGLQGISD
ncbi:MAG: ATP-binding cassette domain-containing protein, partial [Microcystis sp. M49637_WE12]|nr:ATP-binding cassette domain-containing protein [Microcystis sp. M49637_WE12]